MENFIIGGIYTFEDEILVLLDIDEFETINCLKLYSPKNQIRQYSNILNKIKKNIQASNCLFSEHFHWFMHHCINGYLGKINDELLNQLRMIVLTTD